MCKLSWNTSNFIGNVKTKAPNNMTSFIIWQKWLQLRIIAKHTSFITYISIQWSLTFFPQLNIFKLLFFPLKNLQTLRPEKHSFLLIAIPRFFVTPNIAKKKRMHPIPSSILFAHCQRHWNTHLNLPSFPFIAALTHPLGDSFPKQASERVPALRARDKSRRLLRNLLSQ